MPALPKHRGHTRAHRRLGLEVSRKPFQMKGNGATDLHPQLLTGRACSHTTRQIRDIGRNVLPGLFDHNG